MFEKFVKSYLWSGMTQEIKSMLQQQSDLVKASIPEDIQEILTTQEELLKEHGAEPVWEMDEDVIEMLREEADRSLRHEALNVYGAMGIKAPYLSPTWYLHKEPGMDDVLEKAGESLQVPLMERLSVRPVVISDYEHERLFIARFEIIRYAHGFQYQEALLDVPNPLGWVDFLAGFHYGDCEMLILVGEVSTKSKDQYPTDGGEDNYVPPVPTDFFDESFEEEKIVHDYIWVVPDHVEGLCDSVGGEPEPESPRWWHRINMLGGNEWPYPGEFMALSNRIFPNLSWAVTRDIPDYSPFLFSGSWMDTVFITSAQVDKVETHERLGYQKLYFKWRNKNIVAYTTDFANYKRGDRATILKDVTADKPSELWNDEDMTKFDEEVWRIVPLTYYNKGFSW